MIARACGVCGTIPPDELDAVCTACGEPLPLVVPVLDEVEDELAAQAPVDDEWGVPVDAAAPAIDPAPHTTTSANPGIPLHALPTEITRTPECVRAIVRDVLAAVADGALPLSAPLSPAALCAAATDGAAATPLRFVLRNQLVTPPPARYLSPISVRSGRDDHLLWWSLGLLLAEMLTGRHPWGGYPLELGDPEHNTLLARIRDTRPILPTCREPAWSAQATSHRGAWLHTVFLVHGLAHLDSARRWDRGEVAAWLDGVLVPPVVVGDMGVWDAESLHLAAEHLPIELAQRLRPATDALLRQIDPDFARLVEVLRSRGIRFDGSDEVQVLCMSPGRLITAAARLHADIASAAPTSRLSRFVRGAPPSRVEDAAEFLLRLLRATPSDGVVTRAEARYVERVTALRGTGVPIDPARIDRWLRGSDEPDVQLQRLFDEIRATYGATRYAALRHALECPQPTFLEILLGVGALPSAIVSREEVARQQAERSQRAQLRVERQWRVTIAAADSRASEAEAQFAALLSSAPHSGNA